MIGYYEALMLKHNQLKRKLYTACLNNLSEEVITSLKKQKYSVKQELNSLQNPFSARKITFGESEKVA